ncbi:MAG: twin-arginine translocation signal domain-containing protein, partial [Tannerellaceae bacterium]|nr:twin-arginine translocation signal domain-containing protein [Tannerellaceae bacterium]
MKLNRRNFLKSSLGSVAAAGGG